MVTPTDETTLAVGLAGVQATVTSYGERFDRLEDKFDGIITRIDGVFPRLATLEAKVESQQRQIDDQHEQLKDHKRFQRELAVTGIVLLLGILGDILIHLIK